LKKYINSLAYFLPILQTNHLNLAAIRMYPFMTTSLT